MTIGSSYVRGEKLADRFLRILALHIHRQANSYAIDGQLEKGKQDSKIRSLPTKTTPKFDGAQQQSNPFLDENLASSYEQWYSGPGREADRLEKRLLERLIRKFDASRTILEVGCGTGHFTRWMRNLCYDVTGLDSSPAMLQQARILDSNEYVLGDAIALPFPDRAFDITVFITTLEFISRPDLALAEAARVSRQGILLGVINRRSLLGWRYRRSENPLWSSAQFYTPSELKGMIHQVAAERIQDISWRTTLWPIPWLTDLGLPWGGFIGLAARLKP